MAKKTRQIIKIDEDKCNGCGQCVTACAEGALQIIDGKARLVAETFCDGLGACIGECPQDALTFETREADDFDEVATVRHLESMGLSPEPHFKHMAEHGMGGHNHEHSHGHSHGGGFVCPSARTIDRTQDKLAEARAEQGPVPSQLRQWPVKLYLVNPQAPYFQDAELLVAADCVPFAYGATHPDFIKGKTLVTGCPKFDDVELYLEKLTDIVRQNNIRSITVLQMEVPCCAGMLRIAQTAVSQSGKQVPVESVTISLTGEVKNRVPASV
ncbi:MAG: 4Fe-4S binding protein [Armatimonadetes bacterium]|nr:4Fe-4S binding protein [Armatimonadota bacterium]